LQIPRINLYYASLMRILIQRVNKAEVYIENQGTVGAVDRGFLILCGFRKGDNESLLPKVAEKCLNLRVFEDNQGKMNLSLLDIKGDILVVSQFTLYADCRKGRRPSFDTSLPPEPAEDLYNAFIDILSRSGLKVAGGVFGAKMNINLVNHGPVTIWLDSDDLS